MKEGLYFNKTSDFNASKVLFWHKTVLSVFVFTVDPFHLTSNVFAVFCIILPSKLKNHTFKMTVLQERGYDIQANAIFQDELLMNVKFRKELLKKVRIFFFLYEI